jgi:ferredoxin
MATHLERPYHVAIVGSGPSGFFAAASLLKAADASDDIDIAIDMLEMLPTPWGLVRSGVAPDHPKIKSYQGTRMLYVHPDECVDCGACEPVCPVDAIYHEDDLPDQWSGYSQINADFFAELGSPGGASKIGITENDPIAVKNLERAG